MLYSEQVVGETFEPIISAEKEFTVRLSGELNQEHSPSVFSECNFNSQTNSGAMLLENVTNTVFKNCRFESGLLCCIDISRCSGLRFEGCEFSLSGDRQIRIRCASNLIKFARCKFYQNFKKQSFAFNLGPWSEEEKVWRPAVSGIHFENCSFSEGLKPYIAFRALPANIQGKIVNPWLVNLLWYAARIILRKKRGVDYSVYEHEQL